MNECKDNVKDVAQVADLIAASSNGVAGIFAYFIGQTLPDSYSLAYMGPGALAQLGGDAICQHVPMLDHILNRLNGISKVSSPLILDLDGNGVETTIIGDGAYFDFESDGHSEATAWVGSDDALLVRDLNNDGRIDVGSELFGADTYLSNGMRAANGFQALADLDTNFDGIVDQFDEQFATLKLWKDENGNGISESTELYELAELGVSSLNVEYQVSNYVDSNGNQHKQLGTYTSTDGNSYSMTDVWFKTNTIYAVARDYLEVSPQIDDLPDLRGYGHVYSLHQAMVRDSTGRIQEFLNQYMVATTMLERRQALESLVHSWADVDAVNVGSRGTYINARDLAALEKFFDFDFIQDSGINAGTKKPGPNTAAILKDVYSNLLDIFEARLLAQTHLKDLYENLKFQFNESSNILHIDISGVLDYIDQKLAEDNPNGLIVLRDFSFSMRVLGDVETSQTLAILREHYSAQGLLYLAIVDGASLIEGGDTISFGNGTTVVDAGEGDNSISGGNGNHTVITGSGNDTISLGAGMQTVQAGEGDNMVKLSGAGSREVTTGSGDDMVRLYDLAGSHVTLNLGDGDNVVTNGYYSSSSSSPYKDYNGNANIIVTTGGGNDNLVLGHGNHTVYTSDGDDIISLGNGNTLIDVGEGNNSVSGGNGNHTVTTGQGNNAISFSNGNHAVVTGAGNDTISLGAGTQTVQAGEGDNTVKLSGTGSREVTTGSGADTVRLYDLAGSAITLNLGDGDNVVTNGYYSSSSSTPYKDFNGSANITIATGSGNDNLAFYTGSHVIDTGGGNDVISFGNGNTLVDAGEGHNSISGGVGNHSILTGAGNDTISLGAGTQTVQAGEGDNTVSLSGVGQRQVDTGAGADMIRLYDLAGSHVTLNLGDGDNVVTNGYYSSSSSTPYKDFNGNANIMVMTGNGNDTLALYAGNHVINSGDGNDTISFGNGLTIVDAGEGNNSISGGAGNHSVLTGVGNDSIWLGSGTQTVQAGEGDNTIKFSGIGSREVITGSGADTLRLYDLAGSNVTLNLGDGDNVVTNGYYSSSSSTPYKDFNGNANITVI
ncbi:partial Bifunctional hemolysin/adenylate cyclase, partial [Methylophilaceae bacterium]